MILFRLPEDCVSKSGGLHYHQPVWTQRPEEKSFAPAVDQTLVQTVVGHYTD
jgi:hypothetical protein